MSREVQVHAYCDACPDRVEVDPDQGVQVGFNGEAPRQLDLCDQHRAELYEPLDKLLTEFGQPVKIQPPPHRRATPPWSQRPGVRDIWTCPLCDQVMQSNSAVGHLISQHHGQRPEQPPACPICGRESDAMMMVQHRKRAHGYAQRDEMVAALTKPDRPRKRPARARKESGDG